MVSNKLIVSISTMCLLCSCSNHADRMQKLHAEHEAKYQHELAAQRDSLHWADSMQMCIAPIINELIEKEPFEYIKGEYDELGRYYIKGTDVENNINRSYLHAMVNEYGVVQLISEYRGAKHINHTRIVVEAPDGTSMTSQEVPLSHDGANYRFDNGGVCHESVTFVADSLLTYLYMHESDAKMKCVQMGANGSKNAINLTSKEIRQIADTYKLGRALATQVRSSQTAKVAAEKISVLETKIEMQKQPAK